MLSALKEIIPTCKFYFAGSSEMFGKAEEVPQSEKTKFHPRSSYGVSKVAGYELTRNYREAYNIFAAGGILYNHESPRRGYEFVTRKISSNVAKIKLGKAQKLLPREFRCIQGLGARERLRRGDVADAPA